MNELLFRLDGTRYVPALPYDPDGNPVAADGVSIFGLSAVAEQTGVSRDRLAAMHAAMWGPATSGSISNIPDSVLKQVE